jgi:hypothetical protein
MLDKFSHLENSWIDIDELKEFINMYAHGNIEDLSEEYNKSTGRNYQRDYKKFQSSDEQIADRSSRNSARRIKINNGDAEVGDGKDVDHKDGNPRNNKTKNLRMTSPSKNRGEK